jgi:hypothetical protein
LRSALKVNPDGATGSYTPGDHGFTYINNGLNLVENGRTIFCHVQENNRRCNERFREAERMRFGPGSPTFCVYAMEVEPFTPGRPSPSCDPRRPERKTIGNGLGRLRLGPNLPTITGGSSPTYVSTTSLRHTVGGRAVYLDSATVPVLVAPSPGLLGAIAWLRSGDRSTFAILGDSGPSYGEGSIALHQRLRYNQVPPSQPLGPIPVAQRCGPLERGIRAPFASRVDRGDHCRAGYTPRKFSDIRGYKNIEEPVDIVVLERLRPPMRGSVILAEARPETFGRIAADAGFDQARLSALAQCAR